jgi:hypothetical protein
MLDIYICICIPLINLRQPVVNQCSPCRDGWWAAPWIQVPHVHLTQARSDQRYSQGKIIIPWVTSHHPNLSIRINQHPTGWWLGTYFFMTFHMLGMSSSQLTFIFFGGVETTNQYYIYIHYVLIYFDLTKILGKQSKQWETGD